MSTVDENFSSDIEECLDIARRLSKLETEESSRFVVDQLRILNDFLQKKQNDAEKRVDEEIAEEQQEIESLKRRIEKASDDAETDGDTDIDVTDYRVMWSRLKERFWKKAFDAYISETQDDVKTILDKLIKILKTSYDVCKQKVRSSRDDIVLQILQPGEERAAQTQTKGADPALADLSTKCQRACIPFCLSSATKVIAEDVMQHKDVKRYFVTEQPKDIDTAVHKYLVKCVEFCWVACLQEQEVQIVTTPIKECKKIAHQFQELDKTTHATSKCHVEWPALVQGEKLTVPWELYDLRSARPVPITKQPESSQQYRAVRMEDTSGRVVDDTEELTGTTHHVMTASESNTSTNPRKPTNATEQGGHGTTNHKQTKAGPMKQGQQPPKTRNINADHTKDNTGAARKNNDTNLNRRGKGYEHTNKSPKPKSLNF